MNKHHTFHQGIFYGAYLDEGDPPAEGEVLGLEFVEARHAVVQPVEAVADVQHAAQVEEVVHVPRLGVDVQQPQPAERLAHLVQLLPHPTGPRMSYT